MNKERLDLTIETKFKEVARELAVKRRRSVSGLFEDLIEAESARAKELPDNSTAWIVQKPQSKPVKYSKRKKRSGKGKQK